MSPARRNWTLFVLGWLGIVGNVVAVLLLRQVPAAYRPGDLDAWARELGAHPLAGSASAVAFTLGLLSLGMWAVELRAQLPSRAARAGALLLAFGALFDAIGTVTPLVLVQHVGGSGETAGQLARALLGVTLSLDAVFNFCLGAGLLAIGVAWGGGKRWLRALAVVAGLASLPVSAQIVSDSAANLLVVAGPLWLAFIAVTTLLKWESSAAEVR